MNYIYVIMTVFKCICAYVWGYTLVLIISKPLETLIINIDSPIVSQLSQ